MEPAAPVLILGTHLPPLGVLRVLSGRGLSCFVVDATSDIIVRSRWYRAPERTLAESADSDALARYLDSLQVERAVLIPCTDTWTLAVAGLPTRMSGRFPASVPARSTVEQFVNKDQFKELVERLEIPHPRTLLIRGPGDLANVTEDDLLQGFLKPTYSKRYDRYFGGKGVFVTSREAALRHIAEAAAVGVEFMLQEWIPGNSSKTILIDGFVDRNGSVVAMVARRRIRTDHPKIANTASDVTIPFVEVEGVIPHLLRLFQDVHYRGIFNVEFKFDDRDRRYKIIELNPRPFWLVAHIASAGVDLPWLSYLDAQELPLPSARPYEVGRFGMYEIADATALVRAWSSLRLPEGPVIRPWLRGDHTVAWRGDLGPGIADVVRYLRRVVGTRFRRQRGPRTQPGPGI